MSLRLEHEVTSGSIETDGGTLDLDNNVYVLGDDDECLVVDPAHDPGAAVRLAAGRRVVGIVCTHAHADHCEYAPETAGLLGAEVHLHPADEPLWQRVHGSLRWGADLADGDVLRVAGQDVQVLHTPGHTPGSVCLYVPSLGTLLSGDTLFEGGPGATGRPYSDFDTIIDSIRTRLLTLPAETVVRTGHGPSTTIGAGAADLQAWLDRGY